MLSTRFRVSLCLALVALMALISSGLSFAPTATAAEPDGKLVALARVMAVQDRNTDRLMAIPGVMGTATGEDRFGQPIVLVYTDQAGVPGIPRRLGGERVKIEVTGEFFALDKPDKPPGKPDKPGDEKIDPTGRFLRPVPIGVSTGHPDITAGTIGCRVTDGEFVYALSNNHVYANENFAIIGDNVLQPGYYDGGRDPDDAIGTLFAFPEILFDGSDNTIDAAIALSSTGDLGNATPPDGYGTPKISTMVATINMKVKKYGRTTGQTKGRVAGINATVNVGYMSGTALFVDQIIVTPGNFSAGGDSGSLVVSQRGNNPVGLLFAGSSSMTVCNPINAVLDAFSDLDVLMTIDGE